MSDKMTNLVICFLFLAIAVGFVHSVSVTPEILRGGWLLEIKQAIGNNRDYLLKIEHNKEAIRGLEMQIDSIKEVLIGEGIAQKVQGVPLLQRRNKENHLF